MPSFFFNSNFALKLVYISSGPWSITAKQRGKLCPKVSKICLPFSPGSPWPIAAFSMAFRCPDLPTRFKYILSWCIYQLQAHPPPPPGRPRGIWLLRFARGWGIWPQGGLRGGAHWPTPVCTVISAYTGWGCLTILPVPRWEFRIHLTPHWSNPHHLPGGTLGPAIDRCVSHLHWAFGYFWYEISAWYDPDIFYPLCYLDIFLSRYWATRSTSNSHPLSVNTGPIWLKICPTLYLSDS